MGINVITAEEGSKVAELTQVDNRSEGKITATQIKFFDRLGKTENISLNKVITEVCGSVDSIEEINHPEALKVGERLNEIIKDDDEKTQYGDYDSQWQSSFGG
mgnify:FL=1